MRFAGKLREQGLETPILMLTARDAVKDRIEGLDVGADDYLIKPFAFGELLARVELYCAAKKRVYRIADLKSASWKLIRNRREFGESGEEISLTTKEFTVLEYFARNAGRVIGREELSEHCWDETYDPFTNSIEVFVNRLQQKN